MRSMDNKRLREALARAERRLDAKHMSDEEFEARLVEVGRMHPSDAEDETARRKAARMAAAAWRGRNDGHNPAERIVAVDGEFAIEYPPQGWGLTEGEILGAAKTCAAKYRNAGGVRFTMRDGVIGWEPVMPGNVPGFERIRRITGYLVGAMDRWNHGKRAEERDRVKHTAAAAC